MDFNNLLLISLHPFLLVSINSNLISYLAQFYVECTLEFYLHFYQPLYGILPLLYLLCLPFCAVSDLENVFNFLKTSPLTKSNPLFKIFQYMTNSIPSNLFGDYIKFLSFYHCIKIHKSNAYWMISLSISCSLFLMLTFSPSLLSLN